MASVLVCSFTVKSNNSCFSPQKWIRKGHISTWSKSRFIKYYAYFATENKHWAKIFLSFYINSTKHTTYIFMGDSNRLMNIIRGILVSRNWVKDRKLLWTLPT